MRQGQQNNKRLRGRNRKGPNPLTRSYESNGPDVKIRGTALHIAEKYSQLARDAQSSSDRVMEQRYLQHAEHFYRIVAAAQAQIAPNMPQFNTPQMGRDDDDGDDNGPMDRMNNPSQPRYVGDGEQPRIGASDPQPYVNGNGNGQDSDDGDEQPDMEAVESGDEESEGPTGGQGAGPRRRRRPSRGRNRREGDEQGRPEVATEVAAGDD
jgi:Domain of unknown function (DUF4167)